MHVNGGAMELGMNRKNSGQSRSTRAFGRLLVASSLAVLLASNAQAQSSVTLNVVSAAPGAAAIPNFKYLINIDNAGTTDQRPDPVTGAPPAACTPGGTYPAGCAWTSIAGVPGSSPIYTQGTQADFPLSNVPRGRYLITVLADGYKMDGAHFTVQPSASTAVTVQMQPYPLPTATIQAAVFEDISPVNGAPDVPLEHGLAGFQGHIADYLGEVTTDIFGAPLCGTGTCLSQCYVVSGGFDIGTVPPIDTAGRCPTVTTLANFSQPGLVVEGKLKIPDVGPNRYALSVTPPDGSSWAQTTTLEGNLDWDAWVMEGATGLDTEFVVAGEPFPAVIFGYVPVPPGQLSPPMGGSGVIKGVVEAVKVYIPTKGGVGGLPGTIWGGLAGAKLDKPIPFPWVTLTDLTRSDTLVWAGKGDANGLFEIKNVPAGNYTLTWWEPNLNYLLDLVQVTVGEGETVDMGILPLNGWWTKIEGYVFNDLNRNGIKDVGEAGLANFPVTLKKRENSVMDRGATTVTTDANGYYAMVNAYPMTQWLVVEAYADLFYTTGVTFQADNQNTPTTVLGAGVDVSVLPIIGLSGRLDWGVHAYDATGVTQGVDPRNGGIVGTVSYDTTRNEFDPRYAAVEPWQPGIPNLTVNLWSPVDCTFDVNGLPVGPCDPSERYVLDTDGSFKKGKLLNAYLTETWQRPKGCVARDVDGNALLHGVDEKVLPLPGDGECLEGPLMGVQFEQGYAAVDGNYGFGDGCFVTVPAAPPSTKPTFDPGVFDPATGLCSTGDFTSLPGGRDYLVEVVVPNDALGRPTFKVTREEDINIANGDEFVTQVPPSACAGPLHIVDVAGVGTDGYPEMEGDGTALPLGVTVPASTPTENATFVDIGGTPYEGQARPLCSTKLVTLANGRSIAPTFNYFTDVPVPVRFWGLIVDDLNFSSDPRSLLYGEKAGVPFAPVGIYDYTNRLIVTVESDFNGLFDVLLPSTNRINCPTPSGVCANVYRMVGNDPGVPGRLNANYKPEFRTIAAEFEALPGLIVPADLAPTQVGVVVQIPGGQTNTVSCALDTVTPKIFSVSQPYANVSNSTSRSFTITGQGFGATKGTGQVTLNGINLPTTSWNDTGITVTVPGQTPGGPQQLGIRASNGQSTVNGLTFHVIKTTGTQAQRYNPSILEVGPGKTYAPANSLPATADHAIQRALDAAPAGALVVVYPQHPSLTSANPRQNPRGAYYENLIISKPVKLQGVGPGSPDGAVPGSIIDGGAFAGDGPVAADWYTKVLTLTWDGNQNINDGAVISIYTHASGANSFPASFNPNTAPSIDGFDIRGGDQQGFPGNLNAIGGAPTGLPPNLVTQGGAIFANASARNLQITNNVVQNNGGAYGTIRIGTPDLPASDNNNDGVRIANNRIIANAGTNLAGGIGIYAGANSYEVARNDICGNFSAEYGGGLTVYGLSPSGQIHHNRIYFNKSYDEGGGIMIAGQLPASPTILSPGSGPVEIHDNVIQANLSNDDGGGIRFLQAGNFPMNVYNNFIVNNVSTHEGGGISLNDTPDVRFFNNTVMKNLTTATAVTSNGSAAPAGLSTSANSVLLQASLPAGSPVFSNPLLFNNIFWDNRAGTRAGGTVIGLGIAGDVTPISNWDMGVADASGLLAPTNSILQGNTGIVASPTNSGSDPGVVSQYDTSVAFNVWRNNPAFIGAILVAVDVPPTLMGNYHIPGTSPAFNLGAASKTVGALTVAAPSSDIDGQGRPALGGYDVGADEVGQAAPPPPPPTLPTLAVLDNFNRANANTLGGNWSQVTILILGAAIRVNTNQASDPVVPGQAIWNGASFGSKQGAAFTFANTTLSGSSLFLKASGGTANRPASYIRVRNSGATVVVETTANGSDILPSPTFTTTGTFAATAVQGNTLTAIANADGSVDVWLNTTYLGRSAASPSFTGTGRIGIQLPAGARVDNFSGGTVP